MERIKGEACTQKYNLFDRRRPDKYKFNGSKYLFRSTETTFTSLPVAKSPKIATQKNRWHTSIKNLPEYMVGLFNLILVEILDRVLTGRDVMCQN